MVTLTHIGGPTVLVELPGWRILTDPTFDPAGGPYRFGWGTGSEKTAGPAIDPDALGPIDAVLLTHDHHEDNLDRAGRALLARAGTVVTTAAGARRLGGAARGLTDWQTTALTKADAPTITVTATPCRHGPPLSHPIVGDVIGFALDWGEGVLWFSGDTVLYDGVKSVAQRLRVDVAVLHCGGVRFPVSGPARYTMTGQDAVRLTRLLEPRVAIPVHYEGWKHFRDGRRGVERAIAAAPADTQARFRWLPIGQSVEID